MDQGEEIAMHRAFGFKATLLHYDLEELQSVKVFHRKKYVLCLLEPFTIFIICTNTHLEGSRTVMDQSCWTCASVLMVPGSAVKETPLLPLNARSLDGRSLGVLCLWLPQFQTCQFFAGVQVYNSRHKCQMPNAKKTIEMLFTPGTHSL